jgi:hypothetical protein
MDEPSNTAPPADDLRRMQQFFLMLLRSVAITVIVFVRGQFGKRYIGLQALVGGFLIFLVACGQRSFHRGPLLIFLAIYLVMLVRVRIGVLWRSWRGIQESTLYNGWPLLMRWLPSTNEVRVKQFVEPLCVLGIGFAIGPFDTLLSRWLIVAAIASAIDTAVIASVRRGQIDDLTDAMINQRQLGEEFQRRNR